MVGLAGGPRSLQSRHVLAYGALSVDLLPARRGHQDCGDGKRGRGAAAHQGCGGTPLVQPTPVIILPMEYTSLSRGEALLLDATVLMVGMRVTPVRVRLPTVGQRGTQGHRWCTGPAPLPRSVLVLAWSAVVPSLACRPTALHVSGWPGAGTVPRS